MAQDHPESPQRWTAKRRAALVLSTLKGETSAQVAARKHGLTVVEVEDWRDRFLLGAENALRARPKDAEALKDEQIKKLKQKVGELVLDLDILREAEVVPLLDWTGYRARVQVEGRWRRRSFSGGRRSGRLSCSFS